MEARPHSRTHFPWFNRARHTTMRAISRVSLLTVWVLVSLIAGVSEAALVGVWHMDDTSGAITDATSNRYDGTFNGAAASYGQESPFSTALLFSGSSNVNIGSVFDFDDRSFTIEMWVNQDDNPAGEQCVASKRDTSNTNYQDMHLRLYPNGQIRMDWYADSANANAGTFKPGDWRHLAFTYDYDSTAGSGIRRIYYDGQMVADQSGIQPYQGSGGNFYIGSWGTSQYFRGLIDEARVYDEAIDAATIANHAGGLYESYQPEAVVLVHHNDDDGASIQDSSFWSNNGAYSGAAYQAPGRFLQGIAYNGVDTYTQVADSTEINFAERSFTIEAWVKQEAGATGQQLIFSKRDTASSDNEDMHLRVREDGSMLFGFHGNDLGSAAGVLTQDEWHHVAFVMEAGETGNNRYIYVDGVQVAYDSPATAYQGDGGALQFGRWYGGASGQHFLGAMDETRIYNYALDAATVAQHAAGQYAQYQPNAPLLVMHMEDRSGAIRDATEVYSGNYTGTGYRQDGIYGCGALSFDGSDRVEVATDRVLDFDNRSFTIEMWVNKDGAHGGQQVIMSKRDQIETADNDMHLRIYDTGQIQFDWYGNAVATATGVLESGDWHHLAFTFDLDETTGVQNIFYDGELVATRTGVTPYLGSGGTLYLGSWGSGQYFYGLMDEFRVYNYALSAAAIAAHYELEYETFAIPEPGTLCLLCLAGIAAVSYRRRKRPVR